MTIVFMGTPDFAVPILNTIESEGHTILMVITQPDRPKGRGGVLAASPVKQWANERDILVYQPEKINDPEVIMELSNFPVDLYVVAAYGQILPPEVLQIPIHGCINVHASLLPKYRGASPIQWSIMNGDEVTGVTIMQMGPGLDDGDILVQEEIAIDADETGGSLFRKLSTAGGNLCCMAMLAIENGITEPKKQDESEATYVGMIHKDMGQINFNKSAVEIERLIRAMDPWPSAYTTLDGKLLKIWKAQVVSDEDMQMVGDLMDGSVSSFPNGAICYVDTYQILVKTASGYLSIIELQLESKKRMQVGEFIKGNSILVGQTLGE